MIHKTPESFDSEVIQLIEDLDLVQIGSPEFREHLAMLAEQGCGTFEYQMELDRLSYMRHIIKGLNPLY